MRRLRLGVAPAMANSGGFLGEQEHEQTVSLVMEDINLVSHIISFLLSPQDRVSASLVSRMWNEVVICRSEQITIRSRSLLHQLARKFSHVRALNLGPCCDELQNSDLLVVASFVRLESLVIGHQDSPQEQQMNEGFLSIARNCYLLQDLSLCCLPYLFNTAVSHLARGCHLRTLLLEDCISLSDPALDAISKCRNLEELTLRGKFNFTAQGLAVIGRCNGLRRISLELGGMEVGFALRSLALGCKCIQHISLKVKYVDLEDISRCSSLTCLWVETEQYMSLDGSVIKVAAANKELKELTFISPFSSPSDAVAVGIAQSCHQLEKLCVYAARFSGTALLCLMECKTLKSLTLLHYESTGQGLPEVGLCGLDLQELSLRSGRGIRDIELQILVQGGHSLQVLDLHYCQGLSSIGFSAIAHCRNLQSLNLSYTQVDNLSLLSIANGVQCLKQLSLVNCELLSDMRVISKFTALDFLNLDQCPFVCDEGLHLVASSCNQLANVSLAFTSITDIGLLWLSNCRKLRRLRVPYCRSVKGPGVTALAKACSWLSYVVISDQFRGSNTAEELKRQCCLVHFEDDNSLALVPFGLLLI